MFIAVYLLFFFLGLALGFGFDLVLVFLDDAFFFLYIVLTMLVSRRDFLFRGLSPSLVLMIEIPSQDLHKPLRLCYMANTRLSVYGDWATRPV